MSFNLSRRLFLLQLGLFSFSACTSAQERSKPLLIGTISYSQEENIVNRYQTFNQYLSSTLKAHVELEPTFNERKALERIQHHAWSLVFAPPGVAAIAIKNFQYLPIFPIQEDMTSLRSIIVVRNDSPLTDLKQLQGERVALGQVGSATGYYFPLYNLYGLTLAEILLAPTAQDVIEWVADGTVMAGALSTKEFNRYKSLLSSTEFRILHTDTHLVPTSTVLLGPTVDRTYQSRILNVMKEAPPDVTQAAGYIPNVAVPDYEYMISVIERVQTITDQLHNKPAQLF